MSNNDGSGTIAVGAAIMGIDILIFLVSLIPVCNPHPPDIEGHGVGVFFFIFLVVPILLLFFIIGLVVLIFGLLIRNSDKKELEAHNFKMNEKKSLNESEEKTINEETINEKNKIDY